MDITAEKAKQCYIKHHGTEPEQAGFYHYQEWDTGVFVYAHNKFHQVSRWASSRAEMASDR